jgi:hypothetical protein
LKPVAIGYHVPEQAGIGLTGETIGILRKALDKGYGPGRVDR